MYLRCKNFNVALVCVMLLVWLPKYTFSGEVIVPDEVRKKFPDLVELILASESMNDEERNYWIKVLPDMTADQVTGLKDILQTEKEKLAAIDAKYASSGSQATQQTGGRWVAAKSTGCKVRMADFSSEVQIRWTGECTEGKASGVGELTTLIHADPTRYRYIGGMKDGKMEGDGILYLGSGASYTGQWHDDKYDGIGILIEDEQWQNRNWKMLSGYWDAGQLVDAFPVDEVMISQELDTRFNARLQYQRTRNLPVDEKYQSLNKFLTKKQPLEKVITKITKRMQKLEKKKTTPDAELYVESLRVLRGHAHLMNHQKVQAANDYVNAGRFYRSSGYLEDAAILLLQAAYLSRDKAILIETENVSKDLYGSTKEPVHARILGIAYLLNDKTQLVLNRFKLEVELGISPLSKLSYSRSSWLMSSEFWDRIQSEYIRQSEDMIIREELSHINQMPGAVEQALYISDRLSSKWGSFGIPSKYMNVYYGLRYTTTDLIVVVMKSDYIDLPLLGTKTVEYIYVGKIFANDLVYVDGNYIRTLHKERDLSEVNTKSGSSGENWHEILSEEAYGSITEHLKDERLYASQVFTRKRPSILSGEYIPTTYSTKSTSWSGGVMGFIEEHPVATLVIAAAIAKVAHDTSNSASSSSSNRGSSIASDSYSSSVRSETEECYKILKEGTKSNGQRYVQYKCPRKGDWTIGAGRFLYQLESGKWGGASGGHGRKYSSMYEGISKECGCD